MIFSNLLYIYCKYREDKDMQKAFTPFFTPYSSSASCMGYCNICYQRYDDSSNKPLLICRQNHLICKTCMVAIRDRLRCPFCREDIDIHRIRVDRQLIDTIASKQKNKNAKKHYLRVVQTDRLNTDHTGNDQLQDEIFNPLQLLDEGQRRVLERNDEGWWVSILLFVYIFCFQISSGIFEMYHAFHQERNSCYDSLDSTSSLSLRNVFMGCGYSETLIAVLFVYFTVVNLVRIINNEGLICFYQILIIFISLKDLAQIILYLQILREGQIQFCSRQINAYFIINILKSMIQIYLGAFLIAKLNQRQFTL